MTEDGISYTVFADRAALLAYIREKADDIDRALIPQHPYLVIKQGDQRLDHFPAGLILHMVDGTSNLLARADAQLVLNDGVLQRLRIPIELHS